MIANHAAALQILMNEDLFLTPEDLLNDNSTHLNNNFIEDSSLLNSANTTIPEFAYIGDNKKNFLILTNETLNENHQTALENTLLRKQMNLDDVAVVDYSAYPEASIEQLYAVFMSEKIVCFGLEPTLFGLPEISINKVSTNANYQILFTYAFNEMLGNKEKTKASWEPMKIL